MHALIQGVILGVLTGGVYALMASGQTLIFGIMKVVNLAQGAMVVLAAYLSYTLFTQFGIDPLLSIPITTVVMFVLGVVIQLAFLRPLKPEDIGQLSLLVTFAVALLLEGIMGVLFNTTHRSINTSYADSSWTIAGYQVTVVGVYAFALSLGALALLFLLLNRTGFGRAVRATVQNPVSARLLGVDTGRISALGFGLGAATAAAAGSVYGLLFPFNPSSHYDLISKLLSIVVLGGLGSISGSVVAAIIVSTASAVVASTITPIWSEFTFFVILLAVLLVRPRGLFGAGGAAQGISLLRCARRSAPARAGALGSQPADLHAHVRGAGKLVEPGRRFRRLPVAGPRRVLRHRRLRPWNLVPASLGDQRLGALRRPAGGGRCGRGARSPSGPDRDADPRRRLCHRHHHAAVRRADAGVQPSRSHRRSAGAGAAHPPVRPRHLRMAVLLRDARAPAGGHGHHLRIDAQQARSLTGGGARRRGQGTWHRRARHRHQGGGVRRQRGHRGHGGRRLGLLRELHLP